MRKNKYLPVSLELAAKATSLDKIKIIPVNLDTGIRHRTKTLFFFGWRNKLIKECVDKINGDIDTEVHNYRSRNSNPNFYNYVLGKVYRKGIFMYIDCHYTITTRKL